MSWRLALALDTLRREFNTLRPDRDRSSDGAIGDASHAASWSDHNPNAQGVVCALDVDTDLDGTDDSNDEDMNTIVEWVRLHPHPQLKYVIYRANDPRFGMFSAYEAHGYPPFTWRPYTKDPHISHPHFSVGAGLDGRSAPGTYDDTIPWGIAAALGLPAPQPQPPQEETEMKAHLAKAASGPNEHRVFLVQPYYTSKRHLSPEDFKAVLFLDSASGGRLLEDQAIHEYGEIFLDRIPTVGEA